MTLTVARFAISPPPNRCLTMTTTAMEPPPPRSSNPNPEPVAETLDDKPSTSELRNDFAEESSPAVPYNVPPWSGAPCHRFGFEVLEDGSVVDRFDVYEKGAYVFGRSDLCDFVLDHRTISQFHAVVQYKRSGESYIYDLGSTHGTFVNKKQVEKRTYVDLHVGDVIQFGQSSSLYIFQGQADLMPLQPVKCCDPRNNTKMVEKNDELADSLNDLFTSVVSMVKSELQGTNNQLELLAKMNGRVTEEYRGYGDVAEGLRVFVEQLKSKSRSFNDYVLQIDTIEQQVTEFEAVISMLDRYVSMLESKVQSAYHISTSPSSS